MREGCQSSTDGAGAGGLHRPCALVRQGCRRSSLTAAPRSLACILALGPYNCPSTIGTSSRANQTLIFFARET